MKKIFKKIQNEKGISLVELVVAVSIFSLVMLAATGIFISAMKAQKLIIAKQNVANNMLYVMEFMAKELRMAQVNNTDAMLTFNNGAGAQIKDGNFIKISFKDASLADITYEFDSVNKKISRNTRPLSSDEVSITGLNFKINDWSLTDDTKSAPLITIFMKAKSKNGVGGEIELQTSISPRTY